MMTMMMRMRMRMMMMTMTIASMMVGAMTIVMTMMKTSSRIER